MSATVGVHASSRPSVAWLVLAALALAPLTWWWTVIDRGPVLPAALMPFAIPPLLVLRAFVRSSSRGGLLIGLVLGICLAGATGRGAIFVIIGVGALMLEIKSPHPRVGRSVLAIVGGFVIGLAVLASLPTP